MNKRTVIGALICIIFFGIVGSYELVNNVWQGETKTCTVDKVTLTHDSGSGVANEFLDIDTPDCGTIVMTKVKSPSDVNMARLAELLQDHQGKKFEFIGAYIQLQEGHFASIGVKSLTPVE